MKITANLWTSANIVLKSIKIYVKFVMVAPLPIDRFVYVLKRRRPQNNFTIVAPLHIHNKGNPEKKITQVAPSNPQWKILYNEIEITLQLKRKVF